MSDRGDRRPVVDPHTVDDPVVDHAIVVASGLEHHSKLTGIEHGVHKVGEVLLGCAMGLAISWLMSKVWPLGAPAAAQTKA